VKSSHKQYVAPTQTQTAVTVFKELPTAQPMREVAPNDLSGPGYTVHKHDIRRGARGRGFTQLQLEEIDLDQEMTQTA